MAPKVEELSFVWAFRLVTSERKTSKKEGNCFIIMKKRHKKATALRRRRACINSETPQGCGDNGYWMFRH
jgi:hypothetical protein